MSFEPDATNGIPSTVRTIRTEQNDMQIFLHFLDLAEEQ